MHLSTGLSEPGDPPEPVLTFSIPPQAPAGILPQIAMLSATTNTADTQHAFDGQPVTFSGAYRG